MRVLLLGGTGEARALAKSLYPRIDIVSSLAGCDLTFDPAADYVHHVAAFLAGQLPSPGYLVPPQQAGPAAGGGGMLGHEHRVAAPGRLPPVVERFGRREALGNEFGRVLEHNVQAPFAEVSQVGRIQSKLRAKPRPA